MIRKTGGRLRLVAITLASVALLTPAAMGELMDVAGSTGGVSNPDSGTDIAGALGTSWNAPPYDCTVAIDGEETTARFVMTKLTPPCQNMTYSVNFTVGQPIFGDCAVRMQVGCDTAGGGALGAGELTTWVAACDGDEVKCSCDGASLGECQPGAVAGEAGSCGGTCTLAGPCNTFSNDCDGDSNRFCITDADCEFCSNNDQVLCTGDTDCDFGVCGPRAGFCSGADTISCVPPSVGGAATCTGTCTAATCGSAIADQCDDNPNRACTTAADCGSCSNAPLKPCVNDGDCSLGTCDEGLVNTDDRRASDFLGIVVRRTPLPPPEGAAQMPLVDPQHTGLLVAGLLTLGIVLLLRRPRPD